jgi:uncharacterized protein
MALQISPRVPRLPLILQRRSTDEYTPLPYSALDRHVVAQVRAQGPACATRLGLSLDEYWSSRQGTAAALCALDDAWGGGFYHVPSEAAVDRAAADAALGGDQLVIDVQTHYVSDRRIAREETAKVILGLGESVAGDLFQGIDKLVRIQNQAGYSLAEYLRCVFLESETAVAVLSSGPGAEEQDPRRILNNAEMVGTRELTERLHGSGRLINHAVVHPNIPGELERMDRWSQWCKPAGWKCYTLYGATGAGPMRWKDMSWMLDDEEAGQPFLRRARETGVRNVCVHKGISAGAATGWDGPSSPRDIGPAAKAFPDINFLVYHSGYEPREGDQEEGPYAEEAAHIGTNRLVKSLKDAGIGPGDNVYAELGTTWYLIMAHPREATHVLGKLLSVLGEDHILWGTDSIWYGSPQPLIDAFRAFQIPEEYSARYGYPQLTPSAKEKILGLNAARLYGMDPAKVRAAARNDDLAWVKAALEEYRARGTPSIS